MSTMLFARLWFAGMTLIFVVLAVGDTDEERGWRIAYAVACCVCAALLVVSFTGPLS
jgi:hypothetical protein